MFIEHLPAACHGAARRIKCQGLEEQSSLGDDLSMEDWRH